MGERRVITASWNISEWPSLMSASASGGVAKRKVLLARSAASDFFYIL